MNKTEQEKIKRFLNDEVMSNTVFNLLQTECLKPSKDRDVQNLAARFMAVEIITTAWKEMEKYGTINTETVPRVGQIGL